MVSKRHIQVILASSAFYQGVNHIIVLAVNGPLCLAATMQKKQQTMARQDVATEFCQQTLEFRDFVLKVRFEDDAFMKKTLLDNFNNDVASDVTIVLENGDSVHCHKLVLSMGSPVFRMKFHERMDETTVVELPIDGEPNAVDCMLRFLYSGHCELNNKNIAAVTALAEYFDIRGLHRSCLEYMKNYLEVNSQSCVRCVGKRIRSKD